MYVTHGSFLIGLVSIAVALGGREAQARSNLIPRHFPPLPILHPAPVNPSRRVMLLTRAGRQARLLRNAFSPEIERTGMLSEGARCVGAIRRPRRDLAA